MPDTKRVMNTVFLGICYRTVVTDSQAMMYSLSAPTCNQEHWNT